MRATISMERSMKLLHWACIGLMTLLVSACGGGGGDGAPGSAPAIQGFGADAPALFVGERARLTATFSGGQGRIEPGIGPVASGVPVDTPPLDGDRRYTLVVEAAGQPDARREIALTVRYRDRYEQLAQPFRAQYHAAVAAGDGSVIVLGGSRGQNVVSDSVDRFDPVTRTFTRIGLLRTGRAQHTATRLADGRILVLGGVTGLQIGNVADLVDERTGAVGNGGQLQLPRVRHAAIALADGRVLVVGGVNRNTVEIWDPATATFRLVAATMRHPRDYPTATLLQDGRVLIAGGDTEALAYTFAEVFDPRTETFTTVASAIAERRYFHAAQRLANGRVLIVGGEHVEAGTLSIVPLASVLEFDPATNTLTQRADLDRPRSLAATVPLDGEMLLFGGSTPQEVAASSATAYSHSGAARPLAAMPVGRSFHTATRMGDGRILIVGGDDARGDPVESVLVYE
jgi:hypothetical protein